MKNLIKFYCSLILLLAPHALESQIELYGQISPAFLKSDNRVSQLTVNGGRPTFLWRLDISADAYISNRITAYLSIRSHQDQFINIDYLAVRLSDISPLALNIQAGKFDIPFGNLYNRRFPRNNFLYSLPLIYQYRTAIMPDYPYTDVQSLINNRGAGGSSAAQSGMPLLDHGLYGTGVMVFGRAGMVDYFFIIMNGTVSNTGGYENGLNVNGSFGKAVRIAVTPVLGFTVGGAFAWGSYLSGNESPNRYNLSGDYGQYIGSIDLEYSRGHLQFFSQTVYSVWENPVVPENLEAFGYYAEAKFTIRPRWYIAGRVNQLLFSQVSINGGNIGWDHDVLQLEGGFGYFIDRNTLLKMVIRETKLYGGANISSTQITVQLVAAF